MPKGSPELTNARKAEIMNACSELYKTMSFREITIKEIAGYTSFTRPSIYNYFQTKEEIFLALFKEEYELWNEDLKGILHKNQTLSRLQLAKKISASLQKRELMLKILSVNLYDMEENSRFELLVSFKEIYKEAFESFKELIKKYCPDMSSEGSEELALSFFAYMHGIYPYAYATEYQLKAMEQAGVKFKKQTICEITMLFFNTAFADK